MLLAMALVGLATAPLMPNTRQVLDAEIYDHRALLDILRDYPAGRFNPNLRALECKAEAEVAVDGVVTCSFLWRGDRGDSYVRRTQQYIHRPEGWRVYPTRLQLKDRPESPDALPPAR